MNPTSELIHIESLRFSYSPELPDVLDIEKFSMATQEKLFLYGSSGSGKTTLLEILSGVLPATSGKVVVCGQDLSSMSSSRRDFFRGQHLGYIFQSFNLIPYLSVGENILLPLKLNPRPDRSVAKTTDWFHHMTQYLGIESLLQKNVLQLSVGQQQRVAVARALIHRPNLLLADEPTSALDFEHREKFLKLLFTLAEEQELGILFVSHDHSLKNLFDRSVNLQELQKIKTPKGEDFP